MTAPTGPRLAIDDPAVRAEVAPIFRRAFERIAREAAARDMTLEGYLATFAPVPSALDTQEAA